MTPTDRFNQSMVNYHEIIGREQHMARLLSERAMFYFGLLTGMGFYVGDSLYFVHNTNRFDINFGTKPDSRWEYMIGCCIGIGAPQSDKVTVTLSIQKETPSSKRGWKYIYGPVEVAADTPIDSEVINELRDLQV